MKRHILVMLLLFAAACPKMATAQTIMSNPANASERHTIDSLLQFCRDSLYSDAFFGTREKAQKLSNEVGLYEKETIASQYLVFRYYLEGNADSLETAVKRTKAMAKKYNLQYIYYDVWGLLLSNYNLAGKNQKAISEAEEMGKEAFADGSSIGIATSYSVSGDAYLTLGLHQEAIDCYTLSIKEMEKNTGEYQVGICNSCYSIMLSYSGLGEYEKLLPYCDKIDSIAISFNSPNSYDNTYYSYKLVAQCGRMIAYSKTGELKKGGAAYKKALEYYKICLSQKDFLLEAEACYFEAIGKYGKAAASYKELTDYYASMGLVREQLRIIRLQAELLVNENNYKKACDFYQRYFTGMDSLQNASAILQVSEFAVMHDLQKAEYERNLSELKTQKTRQTMVTIISACLLTLLLISVFFIIRQRKTNNKLRTSEKDLKKALVKAEESDRLKSAFLANMSHEIRTPLNSIVGFSELISGTDDPQEKETFRDIIKTNSEQLLTLVNDVLDLSKIESGVIELKREHFDIVPFINNLFSSFKTIKRSPNVNLTLDNPYESHMVDIDKHRMAQLFTNFVTNSLKFTKEGEVRMGYRIEGNGSIYIYVSDTGIGISDDQKPKVFDRFFKLNDFSQGNGLGLAISKAIVKASNGEIGVESEVGKGSKFWARIPQ